MTEVASKRLELLRALVPNATRIAVLINPASSSIADTTLGQIEPAARAMGLQIRLHRARNSQEIDAAFEELGRDRPDALFVSADGFYTSRRVQLAALAARYAIPTTYASREIAHSGGLMSYGPSGADAYRQAGVYVGRILKGAKPADLPVVQSTKFDLVINQQTARMLGLAVPLSLLAIADEVIE